VLDLRSIRPLDEEAILKVLSAKQHRAVLVDENKPFCGVSAQIAATIQEKAFDDLDAPVQRVCSTRRPCHRTRQPWETCNFPRWRASSKKFCKFAKTSDYESNHHA
jgi:pyruvate/2-oxoglutarate/acetoin dehydrogenase E1 component